MRGGKHGALGATVALGFLCSTLLACGISYGEGESGTEVFKRLTIEGSFRPEGALTLTLDFEQPYPVTLDYQCDLLVLDSEATAKPTATRRPTAVRTRKPTPPEIPRPHPTATNKIITLIAEQIPANPSGAAPDEATPVPGTIQYPFRAPEFAGRYLVRCFTGQDENNAIVKEFTVRPLLEP